MSNIAIVGGGNIGSRHLQALSNLNKSYYLFVVDPSTVSQKIAKEKYNEVKNNNSPEVFYVKNANELMDEISIAIIATNADVRLKAIEYIIKNNIRYLILEKILFQDINEYDRVGTLLDENGIQAWVNCWRRAVPFYQDLKNERYDKKINSIKATGDNWGLASNCIHLLDLIAFLTDMIKYEFNNSKVDIIPSKRDGYFEFAGEISGLYGGDIPFNLKSDYNSKDISLEIALEYDEDSIIIEDNKCSFTKIVHFSEEKETFEVKIPFQSEMTHLVINDLLTKGDCDLTSFHESCELHLPMIRFFSGIFSEHGITGFPVT